MKQKQQNILQKSHLKMSTAKYRPFCRSEWIHPKKRNSNALANKSCCYAVAHLGCIPLFILFISIVWKTQLYIQVTIQLLQMAVKSIQTIDYMFPAGAKSLYLAVPLGWFWPYLFWYGKQSIRGYCV